MSTETPKAPQGKLMKADPIAALYRTDVEAAICAFSFKHAGRRPRIVGILATDSKPSEMYAEFTRKTCEGMGVDFVLKRVGGAVLKAEGEGEGPDGEGLEGSIIEANEDSGVDGIMVSGCSRLILQMSLNSVCPRCIIQSSEGFKIITYSKYASGLSSTLGIVVLIFHGHRKVVSPFKDVEGLHTKFHFNLYHKYVAI